MVSGEVHLTEEYRSSIRGDDAGRVCGFGLPVGGLRGPETVPEISGNGNRDSHIERASRGSEEHLFGKGL